MWLAYIHRSVRLPVQDIGIVGQFELENPINWHICHNKPRFFSLIQGNLTQLDLYELNLIDHEPHNLLVPFWGTKSHYDFLKDTYMWILKNVGGHS